MDHREKHEPLISTAYCYSGDFSDENPPMPGSEMMGIPWPQSNESSLRCLFPLNEQTFDHHDLSSDSRDLLEITATSFYHLSSRYLGPTKELLNEFCGFGESENSSKQTHNKWEGVGSPSSSSALNSLDLLELQNRKGTLFSMLEEVDRRYKKYFEQMRAVKAGFEAAAGEGAAETYTSKASRVMSKHFRSLRDGIAGQLQATKRAMGEKDTIYVGPTKGETPRLRLVDQCLRQQRAAGATESHPWRPQRGLPERSVSILRAWLFEHFLHPYPTDVDKHILSRQTGLSRSQVSNWFINARVRLWKPMVEEMYMEETKEQDNGLSYTTAFVVGVNADDVKNPNPSTSELQREADPDSLSSIINGFGSNRRYPVPEKDPHCPRPENFGDVGMDFGSYGDYSGHGFGGGVSLTLGLQQLHDLAR